MNATCREIPATPEEVFNFLADIEQLPHWAPRVFERLEIGRRGWSACSIFGEMQLELTAEARSRFIYLHVQFDGAERGVVTFWVTPSAPGRARVRMIFFHPRDVRSPETRFGGSEGSASVGEERAVHACRRPTIRTGARGEGAGGDLGAGGPDPDAAGGFAARADSVYRGLLDELPGLARQFEDGASACSSTLAVGGLGSAHCFGDGGFFGESTGVGVPTST